MHQEARTYRTFLREKLNERFAKNPQLSLRAFAQKSGLSHALLSQVLSGKRNLSRETAMKLVPHLGCTAQERDLFLSMVDHETARDPKFKERLFEKLQTLAARAEGTTLTLDSYEVVTHWYYLTLIELVDAQQNEFTPQGAARDLDLPPAIISAALERLERLGLIERSGETYRKPMHVLRAYPGAPSKRIRQFYKEILKRAQAAVDEQEIHERYLTGLTIAIDTADLPQIAEKIEAFKEELREYISRQPKRDGVYQFHFQFFNQTKIKPKKSGEPK